MADKPKKTFRESLNEDGPKLLKGLAGVVGFALAKALGTPAAIAFVLWLMAFLISRVVLRGRRSSVVLPFSIQCAHFFWFLIGAAALDQWSPVAIELAALAIGLTWVAVKPSPVPLALLSLYQVWATVVSVQRLDTPDLLESMRNALYVHIILRVAALVTNLGAIVELHRTARKADLGATAQPVG